VNFLCGRITETERGSFEKAKAAAYLIVSLRGVALARRINLKILKWQSISRSLDCFVSRYRSFLAMTSPFSIPNFTFYIFNFTLPRTFSSFILAP